MPAPIRNKKSLFRVLRSAKQIFFCLQPALSPISDSQLSKNSATKLPDTFNPIPRTVMPPPTAMNTRHSTAVQEVYMYNDSRPFDSFAAISESNATTNVKKHPVESAVKRLNLRQVARWQIACPHL